MDVFIFIIIFSLSVVIFFAMGYAEVWFVVDLRKKIGWSKFLLLLLFLLFFLVSIMYVLSK